MILFHHLTTTLLNANAERNKCCNKLINLIPEDKSIYIMISKICVETLTNRLCIR